MKKQPAPWTLVYHNAPKGFDSLFGTERVFLSPDQKTIEMQVNQDKFNHSLDFGWQAWIIRVQYGEKGWQIKQDGYTDTAKYLYQELFKVPENVVEDMELKDIHYSIVTYAVQKKDLYLLENDT